MELRNTRLPVLDIGLAKNKDIDRRVVRELVDPRVRTILFLELRATAFQRFVTYRNLAHPTAT